LLAVLALLADLAILVDVDAGVARLGHLVSALLVGFGARTGSGARSMADLAEERSRLR